MLLVWGNDGGTGGAPLSFGATLVSSLVPESSGGDTTTTVTRATTAYQIDFEGKLNLALAGEARFQGARRVRNLLANTEALTGAGWSGLSSGTGSAPVVTAGFTAPDGTATAFRIQADRGAGDTAADYSIRRQSASVNGTLRSVWVKSNTGSSQTFTLVSDVGQTVTATTSWTRVAGTVTALGATFDIVNNFGPNGTTRSVDVLVWHPQFEDTTGRANTNPSEYVSVGVTSAPFHGAGVDGVKYFTTLNGNTVSSNVVTEATGAAINSSQAAAAGGVTVGVVDANGPIGIFSELVATNNILQSNTLGTTWTVSNAADMNAVAADAYVSVDGTTTMDKLQPKATTAVHSLDQAFTFTAAKYTTSVDFRYVPATPQRWVAIICNDGTTTWGASFDLLNGVAGAVSAGATSAVYPTGLANVYRCSVTNTANAAAAAGTVKISLNATDTATLESAALAGTETLGAGMVQHAISTFATSRITTTTIAVQRNADIDQYVSAGNIASTMTIAMDWTPEAAGMGTVFLFGTQVDANNGTYILHDGTNIIARKRISGTSHDATKALTYAANTTYRIVARFDTTNGIDIFVSGSIGTNDTTTTASQIGTNFQIGADGNSLQQACGAIGRFSAYLKSLSDSRIASL